MPVFFEAVLISFGMLAIFFLAFLLVFLLALFLSPVERELSRIVWEATAQSPAPARKQRGSYKDFSKKHS